MFLTLHIPWIMVDTTDHAFRPTLVPPGTYEVEKIPNPFHAEGSDWLRLRGTSIGINANVAAEMQRCRFGDFQLDSSPALLDATEGAQ